MVALDITTQEMVSGRMSDAHLAAAKDALRTDGFVALNDVIDPTHLDLLRDRMLDDLDTILARDDAPFNFNTGNVQQDPPPFPPYLFRDVLLNEMVIAVTHAMLGPGVKNSYYSGNTALPGGTKQPVHADAGQLWPDLDVAPPAFGFVVNIPVVDMDPSNGSTELWPGSHRDTTVSIQRGDIKAPPDALACREALAPPVQPLIRRGGALIRDCRLWHRGMPNHTDHPRPMIAMIHVIEWWNHLEALVFPKGVESLFEHPTLKTNARFVDDLDDYTQRNRAYDFKK